MNFKGKEIMDTIRKAFIHAFLILISVFMVLPILWTFATSIKPSEKILTYPPEIIPSQVVWTNYVNAFNTEPMFRYMLNSTIYAGGSTLIAVIIAALCAYALSRYKFKSKGFFIMFILFPMLMPGVTNLIPLYAGFSRLQMLDKYVTLIILYLPVLLPFSVWVMKNYFDSVPVALEEAAKIDGCTGLSVVTRIIMPLALPGILAISVINFVTIWNEFLTALIFTSSQTMRPVTVGIYNFIGFAGTEFGAMNAAAVSALIPVLIIFLLLREKFIGTMLEGAVKG